MSIFGAEQERVVVALTAELGTALRESFLRSSAVHQLSGSELHVRTAITTALAVSLGDAVGVLVRQSAPEHRQILIELAVQLVRGAAEDDGAANA